MASWALGGVIVGIVAVSIGVDWVCSQYRRWQKRKMGKELEWIDLDDDARRVFRENRWDLYGD